VSSHFLFSISRGAESCIPQLAIRNDCGIFIGTLSVFGTSLTAVSMQQFLGTVMQMLPIFSEGGISDNRTSSNALIGPLTSYGVNRLSASHRYTQLISLPRNDPSDTSDVSVMSIGAKIGLLLMVLSIAAGLAVLIRYILSYHLQQRRMFHGLQPYKKEPFPGKDACLRSQLWILFNTGSGRTSCDSTHSSLSSVSGLSVGMPIEQGRRSVSKKRPFNYTLESIQYSSEEPESIYIVEPDEVEFWQQPLSFRSGLTEILNTAVLDSDPLRDWDSYNNTKECVFRVY
jgi:hypothetical protein